MASLLYISGLTKGVSVLRRWRGWRSRGTTDAGVVLHRNLGALEEVATALLPVDDVYFLCEPSRVKELYVLLADALSESPGTIYTRGRRDLGTEAGFHQRTSRTFPNSSRFTMRMADPPPEHKPKGQSHDAHNATGGLRSRLLTRT